MPKSNMRAPLIKDPATSRAINDLYRHINKLLNSISPDVERYPEEALEGSVRAISDKGENTYRIEGKTRDGWITIPAQKKLNGDKANPGKLRLYNDIVNQSSFDIYSGDTLGIDVVGVNTISTYVGVSTAGGMVGPLQMEFICSILENSTV